MQQDVGDSTCTPIYPRSSDPALPLSVLLLVPIPGPSHPLLGSPLRVMGSNPEQQCLPWLTHTEDSLGVILYKTLSSSVD